MIVIIASIIVISAVIVGVLTYNGVFTDKDKDGIPDAFEEKIENVQKDIKEAAAKVKKKVTRKTKK